MEQKEVADEGDEVEFIEEVVEEGVTKMKGIGKGRKGDQESQQVTGIAEVEKRFDKKIDKVMGIMKKFMAKLEKGTVAKDKKESEQGEVCCYKILISV